MSQDINVVALVKGEERYIFLFNDKQKSQTLRTLGRYASNSKLSFSWYDAAVLSQKVRNIDKVEPQPTSDSRGSAPTGSPAFPPSHFSDFDSNNLPEEDTFFEDDLFF